jgi:hypothetical protein
MRDIRTLFARPVLVLLSLMIVLSLVLIGSSMASASAERVIFGVYSCCGDDACGILLSGTACPQGQTQCDAHKVNEKKAKCCVNACNDPHVVPDEEPGN